MNRSTDSTFVRTTGTDIALVAWSLIVVIGLLLPIPGVVKFLVIPVAVAAVAVPVLAWRSRRRTTTPNPQR